MDTAIEFAQDVVNSLVIYLRDAQRLLELFKQPDAEKHLNSFIRYSEECEKLRKMYNIGEGYEKIPQILEAALGAYEYGRRNADPSGS